MRHRSPLSLSLFSHSQQKALEFTMNQSRFKFLTRASYAFARVSLDTTDILLLLHLASFHIFFIFIFGVYIHVCDILFPIVRNHEITARKEDISSYITGLIYFHRHPFASNVIMLLNNCDGYIFIKRGYVKCFIIRCVYLYCERTSRQVFNRQNFVSYNTSPNNRLIMME